MRIALISLTAAFLFAAPLLSAEPDDSGLDALTEVLGQVEDAAFQLDLLKGMHDALRGRKQVKMPRGWKATSARLRISQSVEVREKATILALIFGDQAAAGRLRKALLNRSANFKLRRRALAALVETHTPNLAPLLFRLLDEPEFRSPALQALGGYSHKATPSVILKQYAVYRDDEKADAIGALASRAEYALQLLAAVERGTVPRNDLTAFTARQLQAFGNERINKKLAKVWGKVRRTSKIKAELMKRYKALLRPNYLAEADLANGRRLFERTCASCHRMYGVGGQVGPDLTGSNRKNLDYVLENVLDPSALINKDYKLTLIVTEDGRLLSGIVSAQTADTITVRMPNQLVVLARESIERMQVSEISMMPEGAFDKLANDEVRDLVAYLKTERQTPLPAKK